MKFRAICPECEGDPIFPGGVICGWCNGDCVVEVGANELARLAIVYGQVTYFIDDKVLYMNANASAVIQTLTDDQLRGCDFILLIDHSGSMGDPSVRRQGISRFAELQEDATAIAREAQRFDDDGLTVIAFSSGVRVFDGVTADKVAETFQEITPRGGTNLAAALEAAFAKVENSKKQAIVLVSTDGQPDDESRVIDLINSAGNKWGRPKIGITFVQVGEAPTATAYLQKLNSTLKVDIVAVVSAKEAEGLSLGQLAWLAQNA